VDAPAAAPGRVSMVVRHGSVGGPVAYLHDPPPDLTILLQHLTI
jgi:hypothetical protein